MRHIALMATFLLAGVGWSADSGAPDPAALARTMELEQPGAQHRELAKMAGDWDATLKVWMDPSQPPVESKATATFTSILDGRYLRLDFAGEMMGQKFTGMGIDGYDRLIDKYTTVWVDSMSTSTLYATGASADGGKTVTYTATMRDCTDSSKEMPIKIVVTHVDADHVHFAMRNLRGGKEAEGLEIEYVRRK